MAENTPIVTDPISAAIIDFIESYEMRGESEEGVDACYTPTDGERYLILDAVYGLLDDEDFKKAVAPTAPAVDAALTQEPSESDFDTLRELIEQLNGRYRAAMSSAYCPSSEAHIKARLSVRETNAAIDAYVTALATLQPAALTQEPVAWRIDWLKFDVPHSIYCGHNSVGDYRQFDPDAKSTPLYATPQPAASVAVTEDQRTYLEQAQEQLEERAAEEDRRGNNSTAKGCEASAYVIRQMLIGAASVASGGDAKQTALQQYDEMMRGVAEPSALERLRFFCSLAMNGQDCLDAESFFASIPATAPLEPRTEKLTRAQVDALVKRLHTASANVITGSSTPADIRAIDAAAKFLAAGRAATPAEPVGWFDKGRNNVRWREGLLNCHIADGTPIFAAATPQQAIPEGDTPLMKMRSAFVASVATGGQDRSYQLVFTLPDLQTLDAAHREWLTFVGGVK